ncbi:MAG: DsbA family protein [Candidatus Doudnabacteria bacterium]|jgi:protein-disulfide isomerase
MENESHKHIHDENCNHGFGPATKIAGSVLVASVIIALSIFYNTKLLLNNSGGLANLQETQTLDGSAVPSQPSNPGQPSQPSGPVTVAERKDAPVLGKSDAKVTIVEFSDFQCPFCKQFIDQTFNQIKKAYIDTGKVKLIFRHFPLPFHVNAQVSAVAAECANQQGKFWQYHDLLFKNGTSDGTGLASADLKKYADSLGLNNGTLGFGKNKFNQCLDANATLSIVQGDQKDGQAAGTSGTPTFYINGKQLVGAQPFSAFQQAIDEALK